MNDTIQKAISQTEYFVYGFGKSHIRMQLTMTVFNGFIFV